jgi:hypothetical protein
MGSSLPPPATLDLVGSAARRDGDTVELTLARAQVPEGDGALTVRLSRGEQVVRAQAEVRPAESGQDVVVRLPAAQLSDGRWALALGRESAEQLSPVTARLLVQGRRPLVLLWGQKAGKSRLPTPKRAPTLAGRVAVGGRKALDAGLRPLPPRQAARIRSTAKSVAKSVLP